MSTPAKKPPIIELWETSRLIPYEHNARIISQAAVEKVAASIREFGFKQPIVVDKDGVIVAGHTRLLAAQRLKVKRVPVIVASDLTDAQARAYRLMDNRSAQETTWEYGMLNIELEELAGLEVNLALTGFDAGELAGLPMWGKTGETDAEAEWDGMPEFEQENKLGAYQVTVHFRSDEDAESFFQQIERPKVMRMWWPGSSEGLEVGALGEQYVAEDPA